MTEQQGQYDELGQDDQEPRPSRTAFLFEGGDALASSDGQYVGRNW